jgi:anti-sigma B factor antagonist
VSVARPPVHPGLLDPDAIARNCRRARNTTSNAPHATSNAEQMPDREDPADRTGHSPQLPAELTVAVRLEPDATVVEVGGELDLLSAPLFAAELESILSAEPTPIAIDLIGTTFMDSAGIHVLVNARQRARRHLAVICAPGPVAKTLELLGLTEMLNVVSSLDEYRRRRAGG